MKMNKWTMGLAAAGVVSLSSIAQAQDAAAAPAAAAASPTLSGYVSTGYKYSNSASTGYFRAGEGRNAFSLDVVDLKLTDGTDKSRYTVELWMGPSASDLGTQDSGTGGTVELMQANFNFNVADGLDLTIGQFGTVVGRETYNHTTNKFYTHSWGFTIEPTHHTGLLAAYNVGDVIIAAGIANTTGPETNGAGAGSGSSKTFLGSLSYTFASEGFLNGTKLYYGLVTGNATGTSGDNDDYHYASIDLPELVTNLSIAVAWDHVESGTASTADSNVVGLYLGYQMGDTTLNARYEMGNTNTGSGNWDDNADGIESITVGVEHPLFDGVRTRVEFRNDDKDGGGSQRVVAANLIYTF